MTDKESGSKESAPSAGSPSSSLTSSEVAPVTAVSLVSQLVPVVSEKMATAGIALSPSTVMHVLRIAMEVVEGAPIKGAEQKELAVSIIKELAGSDAIPEEHRFLIKSLVDGGLINDTIELVVDATKGNLDVNKVAKVANGCLSRILAVCFRKETEEEKKKKQELKDERDKQKKAEYKAMLKGIRANEEKRKKKRRDLEKALAAQEAKRKQKKEAKKAEKQAKKEAKKAEKQTKKEAKKAEKQAKKNGKKLPSLNVPEGTPSSQGGSASLKVPSELSFPALSSSLPDSVVLEDIQKKKEGTDV
jgi:hypothetical protein